MTVCRERGSTRSRGARSARPDDGVWIWYRRSAVGPADRLRTATGGRLRSKSGEPVERPDDRHHRTSFAELGRSPDRRTDVPSISIDDFPSQVPSPTATAKGAGEGPAVRFDQDPGPRLQRDVGRRHPSVLRPRRRRRGQPPRTRRGRRPDLPGPPRSRQDRGVKRTLTGTGTVATNDGRTVQVTILFTDYLAGTARPALFVTTTVVDSAARPVLLTQVIQNPTESLRFLRTEVIKAAKKKGEPVDALVWRRGRQLGQLAVLARWPDLLFPGVPARRRRAPLYTVPGRAPAGAVRLRQQAARAAVNWPLRRTASGGE